MSSYLKKQIMLMHIIHDIPDVMKARQAMMM